MSLEHGKLDKQISMYIKINHRIQISQKTQKRKVLEKPVPLYNLCFKQSKCNFDIKEIFILEVVIGQGEVQIKDKNVKTVKEWKTPTMIKEVESFLKFVNFYQCFIKNFSYTTKLLDELKDKKKYE